MLVSTLLTQVLNPEKIFVMATHSLSCNCSATFKLPYTIILIKSRTMTWEGHSSSVAEETNTDNVLIEKHKRKKPFRRLV
jgi:hypothetical protein